MGTLIINQIAYIEEAETSERKNYPTSPPNERKNYLRMVQVREKITLQSLQVREKITHLFRVKGDKRCEGFYTNSCITIRPYKRFSRLPDEPFFKCQDKNASETKRKKPRHSPRRFNLLNKTVSALPDNRFFLTSLLLLVNTSSSIRL